MPQRFARLNIFARKPSGIYRLTIDEGSSTAATAAIKTNTKSTQLTLQHLAYTLFLATILTQTLLFSTLVNAQGYLQSALESTITEEIIDPVKRNKQIIDAHPQADALKVLADASPYNWVPVSRLPEDLLGLVQPGCHGLYIDTSEIPDNLDLTSLLSPESQPLIIEADHASLTAGTQAEIAGNVRIIQGSRSISAGKMTYDKASDSATLHDGVSIKEPGIQIKGESANISTTANKGQFNHATFIDLDTHMRGSAETIEQLDASKILLINGSITSCEPGSTGWSLQGKELTVDREKQLATGRNVQLKIGEVPVFYLPYISIPVGDRRQSGILPPSFNSSDNASIDIAIPYYWNIAPNYDATITPRIISGRGTMVELQGRYLSNWMYNELGLAFLPNDGGNQDSDIDRLIRSGQTSEELARPNKGNNRWLAQWQHEGGTASGLQSNVDYTRVSDFDYFRDLGTASLSVNSRTYLEQTMELGYRFENWRISALAQSHQVLLLDIDSPYKRHPQISFEGIQRAGDLKLSISNEFTSFKHRNDFRGDLTKIITGSRFATDYRLSWKKNRSWGYFKPEVGYKSLNYRLDERDLKLENDSAFSLGTGQVSFDAGLIFEHPEGKYLQTLEPRFFYLYREYTNHHNLFNLGNDGQNINFDTSSRTFGYGQLYRDSRFIGGDRLDDANQTTLGLSSRWYNNATNNEIFSVSVGQIFHFEDRRVLLENASTDYDTENSSEFAAEVEMNLGSLTKVYLNGIYDTSNQEINRGSAGLQYIKGQRQTLFNLSYSFIREDSDVLVSEKIDQVDISLVQAVKQQWYLMGRLNYDFHNDQELDAFVGLEYNDCCFRFKILARRWLDSNIANLVADKDAQYDNGIIFEFELKGLGPLGTKLNTILSDGILGYDNWQ
ncbi:MAG: LPS biosynthesis protein [Alteromonadaceae bacterium]|nr:MAG: LPS biosynthesis protein [Alteromonadaceae bacterium]